VKTYLKFESLSTLSPSPLGLLGLRRKVILYFFRVSTERYKKRYPGVTCDCTIASGYAASHHTQSEPPLRLPQPKSGTGVRAEKRRGVSFETTSTNAGFPSGRSAADASFNAYDNASWILLKQSTAFLYESLYAPCHRRRSHSRVSTPVESVATLVKEK